MLKKLIANMLPHVPKKLVWIFSKRYIAGETIEEGILAAKMLNELKIDATIDLLGEFIKSPEEAEDNKNQYLNIVERFIEEKVKCNFSLKPTMFGLLIDKNLCYNHIREIVTLAKQKKSFVRIDMEDSQCVDMEIELFRKLRNEFPENVGLVVQAYLRRTLSDLKALNSLNSNSIPISFRLCKGIYIEPEEIAYKDYQEVRNHYLEDLEYMFINKMYVGIATHDSYLVENAYKLIEKHNVHKSIYEFQMLYRVTPELRKSIIDKGYKIRVYIPYGKH